MIIDALTSAAALAWAYLLCLHGGFWRTGHRLPPGESDGAAQAASSAPPRVTAVIPARNEAGILPACLPSLLSQDYQGALSVIVVDDDSSDCTAKVAAALGQEAGWRVRPAAAADPAGHLAASTTTGRKLADDGLADPGLADRELADQ